MLREYRCMPLAPAVCSFYSHCRQNRLQREPETTYPRTMVTITCARSVRLQKEASSTSNAEGEAPSTSPNQSNAGRARTTGPKARLSRSV
ncbi:hypothetical protein BD626DRAFT_473457 [Schizophyllum amplum]|uniref:Uncharacterized protein n=1 Tax=Schizophyllum amplum TaxID=97359 RepID=A0A550CWT7_9AGAR|nr:hypothetical protein BD626DRAFT_473457 [Auriculariopsis ampla]